MYDYLYWFAIYSPSYTIFVWSGFRSILRGDRLILRGGGLGNYIGTDCFQHELGQKNYFQFDAKILIYIRNKILKKRGGGVDRMTWIIQSRVGAGEGGGGRNVLFKIRRQDRIFHVICKYFCKLIKYRYVHVHIMYMLMDVWILKYNSDCL